MNNTVIESGYRRFVPVGQGSQCKDCPSYCKTSCARQEETDNHIDLDNDFKDFESAFAGSKSGEEY